MINIDERSITRAVLEQQAQAPDGRLREVLNCLVQHLHDFAREAALTEDEWFAGIQFLTRVGHVTTDKRQEFILLSDVLGLSMLVTAQNQKKPRGCTEATVFGPFHVEGSETFERGADISNGAPGAPCFVSGHITDLAGARIARAMLEIWQADQDGFYDVQYTELEEHRARGTLVSDANGNFQFRSILAEAYPIPHDGPVGDLLKSLGRHPWRPAHLHFRITAPGYRTLVTHVFRAGGRYLDSDAVFGVRSSLIADWVRHEPGMAPDGSTLREPFYTLEFDFVLDKEVAPLR